MDDNKNMWVTLENYVERYMPLKILNMINKIIRPLYIEDVEKTKKLEKSGKKFTQEM